MLLPALDAEWARPPVVDGLNGELEPKVLCLVLAAEVARSALSASSSMDLVGGLEERRNSANSEYERRASPSVSTLRMMARSSVSEA